MMNHFRITAMALALLSAVCMAYAADNSVKAPVQPSAPKAQPVELKLTASDTGKKHQLKVGDTLVIELKGNPTTGYQWSAVKDVTDSKVLAENNGGMKYVVGGQPGMVGAGGTYYFYWKATAPGETKIKLEYKRSWEKGEPARTMEATVAVTSDGTAATASAGKELKLVIADNGKTNRIKVGDTVTIELAGNATTGYQWSAVADVTDKKILPETNGGRKYVVGGQPGMVGAGGTYYFYWKAEAPGETKIKLEYKRSWEKGEPARTMDATIIVEPADAKPAVAGKSVNGQSFAMQNGKPLVVDAAVNDVFSVTMSGNPTTGYQWSPASDAKLDEKIATLLSYEYEAKKAPAGMVGVGGEYKFNFKATGKGTVKVKFVYARSWEKNVPPIETHELTINVK